MESKINNSTITYVIMGDPIPLERPHIGRQHLYDAQKHKKEIMRDKLEEQHGNRPLYKGPLLFNITFFMPLPQVKKTHFPNEYHKVRPDLSNLVKFYEDVANGILYKDDATISYISARKKYDQTPRTELIITILDDYDQKENLSP